MKQLGRRVPVRQGWPHLSDEDSRIKMRARPRSTGAPTVRPRLFGFARPAGPDHGPKEDSTVKKRGEGTRRPKLGGIKTPPSEFSGGGVPFNNQLMKPHLRQSRLVGYRELVVRHVEIDRARNRARLADLRNALRSVVSEGALESQRNILDIAFRRTRESGGL